MKNTVKTTEEYWDCECKMPNNYIWPKDIEKCDRCGAKRDEQPDSRINEVENLKMKKDKVEQINKNVRTTAKNCVDLISSELTGMNFDEQYLWSYIEEAINNSVTDETQKIQTVEFKIGGE